MIPGVEGQELRRRVARISNSDDGDQGDQGDDRDLRLLSSQHLAHALLSFCTLLARNDDVVLSNSVVPVPCNK